MWTMVLKVTVAGKKNRQVFEKRGPGSSPFHKSLKPLRKKVRTTPLRLTNVVPTGFHSLGKNKPGKNCLHEQEVSS